MVSKKQSISFSITLLSSIAVLFIWFSSSFANKYDYADSYEDIVKELTKSEKAIKGFFDSATTKNAKKVILYYESNGKFAIKSIEVPDVKTNPSVNLKIYFDYLIFGTISSFSNSLKEAAYYFGIITQYKL